MRVAARRVAVSAAADTFVCGERAGLAGLGAVVVAVLVAVEAVFSAGGVGVVMAGAKQRKAEAELAGRVACADVEAVEKSAGVLGTSAKLAASRVEVSAATAVVGVGAEVRVSKRAVVGRRLTAVISACVAAEAAAPVLAVAVGRVVAVSEGGGVGAVVVVPPPVVCDVRAGAAAAAGVVSGLGYLSVPAVRAVVAAQVGV